MLNNRLYNMILSTVIIIVIVIIIPAFNRGGNCI